VLSKAEADALLCMCKRFSEVNGLNYSYTRDNVDEAVSIQATHVQFYH